MGNTIRIMAVILMLGFTASMADDPGHGPGKDSSDGDHHGMMWGPGPRGFGHRGMMPAMMHGMMRAQMVSSSDGGVIVLRGGMLYKYDKDLNLKKQVELPRPEGWGKRKDGRDSGMAMEHRRWHHEADGDSSKPGDK